jgi:hypothetical protein
VWSNPAGLYRMYDYLFLLVGIASFVAIFTVWMTAQEDAEHL